MNPTGPFDPDAQLEMAEMLAAAAAAAKDSPKKVAKAARLFESVVEAADENTGPAAMFEVLRTDPGCTDCLVAVANGFSDSDAVCTVLQAAVQVAERRIGEERIQQSSGLWHSPDGRSYLRARLQLAEATFARGDFNEGVAGYELLLALNPDDNQGARYILLGAYLTLDRVEQARALIFERDPDEYSATWMWARALLEFLDRDFDAAARTLAEAREHNPYVEDLITGAEEMPDDLPDTYELGSPEEAMVVADVLAFAWRLRPLSVAWLRVGGKPGDDVYFGGYSDAGFEHLLNDLDEDEDDDPDDGDDDLEGGSSGGRGYTVN